MTRERYQKKIRGLMKKLYELEKENRNDFKIPKDDYRTLKPKFGNEIDGVKITSYKQAYEFVTTKLFPMT